MLRVVPVTITEQRYYDIKFAGSAYNCCWTKIGSYFKVLALIDRQENGAVIAEKEMMLTTW